MFKVCIQESYHRLGLCRVEYFATLAAAEKRKAELSAPGIKVWIPNGEE